MMRFLAIDPDLPEGRRLNDEALAKLLTAPQPAMTCPSVERWLVSCATYPAVLIEVGCGSLAAGPFRAEG